MTRLGIPIPPEVKKMRESLQTLCEQKQYNIIDASSQVTGRDFLLKIWKLIAASPLSIGISHEDIPYTTQMNIYYELGVAQALGKESIIVKSKNSEVPSDFIRSEYIVYDEHFPKNFLKFLESVDEQAEHYELMADQLEKNPVLAIDYLRRAFLITGNKDLQRKVKQLLSESGLHERAKNSVELLAANF
ncbi:TPA: hypothetical protein ACJ6XF_003311 [Legionella pneumophila]|nr:hypothetical protein [Legionella pneumophila]HBD9249817.1 hypothetical protein [Legionella pneumophila]HBZ2968635.1 hypothetical protein [Legionella pneumophila]HCE5391721.1 hypothetical protein [Legionella pneumophila]